MKVTQKKKKVAKIPNNKKQFRVFIGNLPPQAKNVHLKTYFSTFGNIMEATVKLDTRTRKSKCYGFINCGNLETFEKVLNSEHTLTNRILNCYPALQDVRTHHLGDQQARMVFLNGVTKEISDSQLQQYFSKFGELLRAYGIRNASDGTSKSFGYLEYSTKEDANAVINLKKHVIGPHIIFARAYQKGASRDKLPNEDNQVTSNNITFLQKIGVHGREQENRKIKLVESLSLIMQDSELRKLSTQNYFEHQIPFQLERSTPRPKETPLFGPSLEWINEVSELDSDSDLSNFIQNIPSNKNIDAIKKKIDRCLGHLSARNKTPELIDYQFNDKTPTNDHQYPQGQRKALL